MSSRMQMAKMWKIQCYISKLSFSPSIIKICIHISDFILQQFLSEMTNISHWVTMVDHVRREVKEHQPRWDGHMSCDSGGMVQTGYEWVSVLVLI